MKTIGLFLITAITALTLAGCTTTTGNNAANANSAPVSNANTAPKSTAPTKESLLAMDKDANEAWIKGDPKFFESFLGDKAVLFGDGQRMSKAELLKMMGSTKCEMKSWNLSDEKMVSISPDVAVLTYKGTFDGSCGGQKIPSPVMATSVYYKSGDKWLAAFHNENVLPEAAKAPADADKKDAAKPAEKKDETAKTEASKADAAKEAPKTDAAKTDKADTAAKPADNAADPLLEPLMALERAGWEAYKARDAAKLGDMVTPNMAFVDAMGGYYSSKADVVAAWTKDKCDIKSTSLGNGEVFSLSSTVAMLTSKGTAVGTCEGEKLGSLWNMTIFVKEGDAWKMAFMNEMIAK